MELEDYSIDSLVIVWRLEVEGNKAKNVEGVSRDDVRQQRSWRRMVLAILFT